MAKRFSCEIPKEQWLKLLMPHKNGFFVTVWVKPNSVREKLSLTEENRLTLAVRDAAMEGAANRRVIEILADIFAVPKTRIVILTGDTARSKKILVTGRTVAEQMELMP